MAISWHKRVKGFKSPLRVVAAFLLRSRERLAAHNQRLREEVKSLEIELERQAAQQEQQRQEIDRLRREVAQLQQQGVPVATRMNDVKFKSMVRPGDTIQMEVALDEQLGSAFFLTAKVTCRDKLAVRLQFACTLAPIGKK